MEKPKKLTDTYQNILVSMVQRLLQAYVRKTVSMDRIVQRKKAPGLEKQAITSHKATAVFIFYCFFFPST